MKTDGSISVVLAGFNEEKNIKTAVSETIAVLESFFDDWEVILINDGSKDNTGLIMKQFSDEWENVHYLSNFVNLNFEISVLRGLYMATKKYVIYNAMDLCLDPKDIPKIMDEVSKENLDMQVLERVGYMPTAWRRITSSGNTLLLKILFPKLTRGTPVLNFIQVYRTEILDSITPLARGPIFVWPELIMRAKLCGYKWSNRKVTCHTHEMRSGSFGKPHDIIWGIYEMLRFKLKIRSIKSIG